MVTLNLWLTEDIKKELIANAKLKGITVSRYVSQLIQEKPTRNNSVGLSDAVDAVRALLPTLAETYGRIMNLPPERWKAMGNTLVKKWESERRVK